jgi:hypothetical protein
VQQELPDLRVHEADPGGHLEAIARTAQSARLAGLEYQTASLGDASVSVILQPARQRDWLVAVRRGIRGRQCVTQEDDDAQHATAQRRRAAAVQLVPVHPQRDGVQLSEQRTEGRRWVGDGVDAVLERRRKHTLAVASGQAREGNRNIVGEWVHPLAKQSQSIEPVRIPGV